jgi:hypothetical protein
MTRVIGTNMVKILTWYDNEWGYSCRVLDLVKMMGEGLCCLQRLEPKGGEPNSPPFFYCFWGRRATCRASRAGRATAAWAAPAALVARAPDPSWGRSRVEQSARAAQRFVAHGRPRSGSPTG